MSPPNPEPLAGLSPAPSALSPLARAGDAAGIARTLLADALFVFSGGLALVVLAGMAIARTAGFDDSFMPAALGVYALIAFFAIAGLRHHPHARFGAPNIVTTLRAVVTALFAGLVLDADRLERVALEPWAWGFAGLALLALALDGLDGYLARRLSLSSPYGARYDMEVDALLIFLLSALAYALGKAGLFVLAIGLMRYAFLAAQALLPLLRAELPPSLRRKAVCVLQAAALGAMITPVVEPPLSGLLAVVTVAFLGWSFLVDVVWLVRRSAARS